MNGMAFGSAPRWPPLAGRHQDSLATYQSIVCLSPSAKSVWAGLPAELAQELGGVDGVAAVVSGAVGDPVEVLGVAAHRLEDHAQHGDVVLLAVGSDEVGLPPCGPW